MPPAEGPKQPEGQKPKGLVETPPAGQEMPTVEGLTKLKNEFNNLESGIIKEIKNKQPETSLDGIIKEVETKISADQVLAVMIGELKEANNPSLPEVKKDFFKNFAKTQQEYSASLTAIKGNLDDYKNGAASDRLLKGKYSALFETIGKQENLKTGVLESAKKNVNEKYQRELQQKLEDALKDPENFIADEKAYQEFKKRQEAAGYLTEMETGTADNDKIRKDLDKTLAQLNGLEEIIYKENPSGKVSDISEISFRADDMLQALKNAAAEVAKKNPDIYKRIAPFLQIIEALINEAATKISTEGDPERKKEILQKLDNEIIAKFNWIKGLNIEDLAAIRFPEPGTAYEENIRAAGEKREAQEAEAKQRIFNQKVNALRNDRDNECVKYFFENNHTLSIQEYRDMKLKRHQDIKDMEITLAYKKLYDLFSHDKEHAKKYCDSEAKKHQYEEYYQTLNDGSGNLQEEMPDMVHPYYVFLLNGKIYIATEAHLDAETKEIKDARYTELSSMPGVIEIDERGNGQWYYVTEDSYGTIKRHLLIPTGGIDEAINMMKKYAESKESVLTIITKTLQKVGGIIGAASGVVTNYNDFADNVAKATAVSWGDRLEKARAEAEAEKAKAQAEAETAKAEAEKAAGSAQKIEKLDKAIKVKEKELIELKKEVNKLKAQKIAQDKGRARKDPDLDSKIAEKDGEIPILEEEIARLKEERSRLTPSTGGLGGLKGGEK